MKNIRDYTSRVVSKTLAGLGNQITYLKYDTTTQKNQYGESKAKKYERPIIFNAIIRFNPSRENLEEFGMDKGITDVLVKIPKLDVEEEGLELSFDDKVNIEGTDFFITSLNVKGWSENNNAMVILGCSRRSDNRGKK